MSHGKCETVKVVTDNEDGYKIINKADYDEKAHKLFEEKAVKTVRKTRTKAE